MTRSASHQLDLGRAARAAGAHACARRKLSKSRAVSGHKRVPRVFPGWNGGQLDARSAFYRQVLETVHGNVHDAVEQRLLDSAGEHSHAQSARERSVGPLVAKAGQLDDLDVDAGLISAQKVSHQPRLRQGQPAPPRADSEPSSAHAFSLASGDAPDPAPRQA